MPVHPSAWDRLASIRWIIMKLNVGNLYQKLLTKFNFEDTNVLVHYAVSVGKWLLTFKRMIVLSSPRRVKALESFEMSVFICSFTWYNIPENLDLHQYCCGNLKLPNCFIKNLTNVTHTYTKYIYFQMEQLAMVPTQLPIQCSFPGLKWWVHEAY